MHPLNPHLDRYDLLDLGSVVPELKTYIKKSPAGEDTIDFSDPQAVKTLNRAILKKTYGIKYWHLPEGFLCPPVPGRIDYLYYLNDLIGDEAKPVFGLDIGTGANLIYPLLGATQFKWNFRASDIDPVSVKNAETIIKENNLSEVIQVKLQKDKNHFFQDIILPGEKYTFSMCNPPFHASKKEAEEGNKRKLKNLGIKKVGLNFGGTNQELWCPGGEKEFIIRMIKESHDFKNQVLWFTTLVSKKENLPDIERALTKSGAQKVKTIEMTQGQKKSRFITWQF
jgi:23S rRNA (adenine1618-N6)-methyltransferase